MSSLFAHNSTHPRVQRAAISAAIIVAASLAVVILNMVGLPTRAAAEPLQSVSMSSQLASGSASAVVSDRQLIAAAASRRASLSTAKTGAVASTSAESPSTAAPPPSIRTLDIWTTGFQAQINECRGGVDVTAHYGTPAVAEHWQCGGDFFPTTAGTVVTFTGMDAGTYRVVGVVAVLNAYTAHTSQIPKGYSMLVQTCRNGDSHTTEFIGLQKIG